MWTLLLMTAMFLITLSAIGQLVSGSADPTWNGFRHGVVRGVFAVAAAGDVVRPGESGAPRHTEP